MTSTSEDERGPSRLLLKLNDAMEARRFYEAHQLMRTINFRYTSSKKWLELEHLLMKTAEMLLVANQYESGSDVAIMMTKLFIDNNIPVNIDRITHSIKLLELMQASPERQNFIANIVEWCGNDNDDLLCGKFHEVVAAIYMKENSYPEAWKHCIRINNGKQIARFTLDVIKNSLFNKEEYDLTLAMMVLTLCVAKRTSIAEAANKELHRMCSSEVTDTPLCFGVQFLLEAIKRGDVQIYKTVKKVYWPSFSRSPNICRLVDLVGKVIFKIPDKSRNGFMSSIVNALIQPDTPPKSVNSSAADALD